MENNQEVALTNLNVKILITDATDGSNATHKFSIGNATAKGGFRTAGASDLFGLGSKGEGSLEWLFVPYSEAAPTEDRSFLVGGTLSYLSGGTDEISMPLIPARITVKPDPSLLVHYFWEKYAQADDPFTPKVKEPSVPFSLGVVIRNAGYGTASNVRFASDQPEIVENEKGLKIDFKLIGSSFGKRQREPDLQVKIGKHI